MFLVIYFKLTLNNAIRNQKSNSLRFEFVINKQSTVVKNKNPNKFTPDTYISIYLNSKK